MIPPSRRGSPPGAIFVYGRLLKGGGFDKSGLNAVRSLLLRLAAFATLDPPHADHRAGRARWRARRKGRTISPETFRIFRKVWLDPAEKAESRATRAREKAPFCGG